MSSTDPVNPRRVVVVGAGVAGLEVVLGLRALAGTRVAVTLVSPDARFSLRALEVARPFSRGHASAMDLAAFAAEQGAEFVRKAVTSVDPERRVAICDDGDEIAYDALVVALGAVSRPAFSHVVSFGTGDPLALNAILADVEQGYTTSVAFVVPKGTSWPLPLYELALMTAEEIYAMGIDHARLHLITPESAPLEVFGLEASRAVRELLDAAGIALHTSVSAQVPATGTIDTGFGDPLRVDRIIALPVHDGPRLPGLPADAHGFIHVDEHARVRGLHDVYAAGDATDQPIKQGGLAAQQADQIAAQIARDAGADAPAPDPHPVLHGRLLTGHRDRFLQRELGEQRSEATPQPLWWPPAKVHATYLAPYLEEHQLTTLPSHEEHPAIDIRVPLRHEQRPGAGVPSDGPHDPAT
jgi:sulfide:quinone oxidoreductase